MTPTKQVIAEFEKKCVGEIDGQIVAFVPLTKDFITSKLELRTKEIIELVEEKKKEVDLFSGEGFVSEEMKSMAKIALNDVLLTLKSTYL